MKTYLRHKSKGTVYEYNSFLADHPSIEQVTEEQAFPERFEPKVAKGRKPKVSLTTTDIPEPPISNDMAELNDELTRKTQV